MRIKTFFRKIFKEIRAPCTLLLHPQNKGTSPFVWIGSAVLRGADPGRKHSFESLPRVCLSGTGMLNHSSICLRAKFSPKTPALSLIRKLPKPGEGKKGLLSHCQQAQGKAGAALAALVRRARRPLPVSGAGGSCCLRPWRQQDVIHLLPSLLAVLRAAPGSPGLPVPPPGASPACAAACESPSDTEPGVRSQVLPESHPLRLARPYLCHLWLLPASDRLLKPADVTAPGLPGRWVVGFALSLDD